MKTIFLYIILFPTIIFAQSNQYNKGRILIDSIHSKRLCIEYFGTGRETIKQFLEESEYVFTGKVVEIITSEKIEPSDYGLGADGKLVPISFDPNLKYWYLLKTDKIYKGKDRDTIKIHSRNFSGLSPFLMLDKEYLIYANKGEIQESPYIDCGGGSCHIKYAENDIAEIKKILRK